MANIVDGISGSLNKVSSGMASVSAGVGKVSSIAQGVNSALGGGLGKASDLLGGISDAASCVAGNLGALGGIGGMIDSVMDLFDDAKDAVEGIMDAFEDVPKLLESRFVGGPKDILAVADVYEITENAIRTRASELVDGVLGKLLSLAKIPMDIFDDCFKPIIDFFKALFDFLKAKILNYLGKLPSGISENIGDIVIDENLLGYAELDLFWNYADDVIYVPPGGVGTYQAVTTLLNSNLTSNTQNPLAAALDRTAETAVYSQLVKDMLKQGYVAPLPDVLATLSSDTVRANVATEVFPNAINPRQTPGPDGRTVLTEPSDTFTVPSTEVLINRPDEWMSEAFQEPQPDPTLYPDFNVITDQIQQVYQPTQPPITPAIVTDEWLQYRYLDPALINPLTGLPLEPEDPNTVTVGDYINQVNQTGNSSSTTGGVFIPTISNTMFSANSSNVDNAVNTAYSDLPSAAYQSLVSPINSANLPLTDRELRAVSLAEIPGIRDTHTILDLTNHTTSWESGGDWSYAAIEELLRHTDPAYLLSRYPGLIQMLLYYYKLPKVEYTLTEEYTRFTSLLSRIREIWYRTTRATQEVGWLVYLSYASVDAVHLFTATPESEIRDEVLVASSHQLNNIPMLLKAQYPLAAI